eukprot:gene6466-13059_t
MEESQKILKDITDAAKNGHLETTKNLLTENKNLLNAHDSTGATPLHFASGWGHNDIVEYLIAEGADMECQNKNGGTPLHWASNQGRTCTVELLLSKKVNVNCQNKMGLTPLHWSCAEGHEEITKILLNQSASPELKDNDGMDAFMKACARGHIHIIRMLFEIGVSLNAQDKYGDSALLPKPRIIESDHPYNNNTNEYTPFEIHGAHSYTITFDEKSSIEADEDYVTFFKYRSHTEYYGVIKYTGGRDGSDKNYPGTEGRALLYIPDEKFTIYFRSNAFNNDWGYKMTLQPLYLNSDPTKNGWTALIWASYKGQRDVVKLLLERYDIDLDMSGWDGNTALLWAIEGNYEDIAIDLVNAGAKIFIQNKERMTPLESAVSRGMRTFVCTALSRFNPFIIDNHSSNEEEGEKRDGDGNENGNGNDVGGAVPSSSSAEAVAEVSSSTTTATSSSKADVSGVVPVVGVGVGVEVGYVGRKYSSAYLPPEMIALIPDGNTNTMTTKSDEFALSSSDGVAVTTAVKAVVKTYSITDGNTTDGGPYERRTYSRIKQLETEKDSMRTNLIIKSNSLKSLLV